MTAIEIKKYANRRLYDTSTSRYINLEDIATLVRNGKDVKVVDARTGEDLTRVTLAQIIMEDARDQPSGLPLELLRQLIVATDQVGREFVMWYLKSAMNAYEKMQDTLQSGLSEVRSAALSPLELMRGFIRGKGDETTSELQTLRARLAKLEARERKKPARKRRKTR